MESQTGMEQIQADEVLAQLSETLKAKRTELGIGTRTSSKTPPDSVLQDDGTVLQDCDCGRAQIMGVPFSDGRRIAWGTCPACEDDRAREEAERKRAKQEAEAAAVRADRAEHIVRYMEIGGVNTRKFGSESLDTFDPEPDAKALRVSRKFVAEFLSGERPSLYLYSERAGEKIAPGTGKTHLAVGIIRELLLSETVGREGVRFIGVPRLLLELQDTFKNPTLSELAVVDKYTDPELLVLDDFGAEKLSDYAARTLYTILDARQGRSTIFTSNLSLADIEARDPSGYMQRITSRIAGDARIIRLSGPDRRLLKRRAA